MEHSHGLYGLPPSDLAAAPAGARQLSPFVPGAEALEELAPGSLAGLTMLAPPGTIERRHALALALRALAPGARLTALAPKDKGGSRLAGDLALLGCEVEEEGRSHHRICVAARPVPQPSWEEAISAGEPRFDPTLGLWTQPGVFSWDRLDAGSALLLRHLPLLAGEGADLGCGLGPLSRAVLASAKVRRLSLVELDRRALACARRNVADARCRYHWADARAAPLEAGSLDFVVMNPPFHEGGAEDRSLGISFLQQAALALRPGGTAWIVANRHLPYEEPLREHFQAFFLREESGGFKVYEARR